MANDWIKMRTDLYRDPKVCLMADMLDDEDGILARHVNQQMRRNMTVTRNVTRNACVGALLSVWGVMRHRGVRNGDDLACYGVGLWVLDDISDMPGFGDAMESVGWVVENDQGLIFPRFFDEYNVEPDGKNKSKNAERQARYREKKRLGIELKSNVTSNVTRNVTVTPREEKRREEINTPLPPKGEEDPSKGKSKTKRKPSETVGEFQPPKRFDTPEVRQALADFESMRLRTGKRIKDRGNVCRGWDTRFVDAKHLLACIDVAISNEYQGISPDYVDPSKVLEAKKPSLWETAKKY
jgi:hypothetical protein